MRVVRRTRIVATIGPASDSPGVLDALVAAGMDVARLNASHSAPGALDRMLRGVRDASSRAGRHVAVMLDLAGPKLRVGPVAPDTVLTAGSTFELVGGECEGDACRACVNHPGLGRDLRPGDAVLLADGRLRLRVEECSGDSVITRVEIGGPLTSRKGVNVPDRTLSVDPVTPADIELLGWALDAGVDMIAQSFVREPSDIASLREAMGERRIPVVAKIEKHEAVESLPGIIEASDAVMVARGDLGVETSPEQVPVVQRRIVGLARAAGKPVIVATEMLESMVRAERPTRAEASDVANAVFQRADAVMLSAETAVGERPAEVVRVMARIAAAAEDAVAAEPSAYAPAEGSDVTAAVSAAVCQLASELDLAAIVTLTQSGATARAVARHRPRTPIVAVTPSDATARGLGLAWGVTPLVAGACDSMEEAFAQAVAVVREAGLASPGELLALTAGLAMGASGATDTVQVRRA